MISKCSVISLIFVINIDMSGFMKTVFKGDDRKIDREVSLFSPTRLSFFAFQSEIWGFWCKLVTSFSKIQSYIFLTS